MDEHTICVSDGRTNVANARQFLEKIRVPFFIRHSYLPTRQVLHRLALFFLSEIILASTGSYSVRQRCAVKIACILLSSKPAIFMQLS